MSFSRFGMALPCNGNVLPHYQTDCLPVKCIFCGLDITLNRVSLVIAMQLSKAIFKKKNKMTVRTKEQIIAAKNFNVREKNDFETRLNRLFHKAIDLNDLDFNQLDDEDKDLISSIKRLDAMANVRSTAEHDFAGIKIRPIVNHLLQSQRIEFMTEIERLEALLPNEQ